MSVLKHWDGQARQWSSLGSPLRPNAQDVQSFEQSMVQNGRTVLLGVTPELARISERIVAIDNNQTMIDAVWPGDSGQRQALRGDWLQPPLPPGIWDNVVGDGSLVLLRYPVQQDRLFAETVRLLKPGGRQVLRCFVRPDVPEKIRHLRDDVLEGTIETFHAFKWRLAMALCGEMDTPNIPVREIFAAFTDHFPPSKDLAHITSWSSTSINTIEMYKDSEAIYSFPTLQELRQMADPHLHEIACKYGDYELARCCPILAWERRH